MTKQILVKIDFKKIDHSKATSYRFFFKTGKMTKTK